MLATLLSYFAMFFTGTVAILAGGYFFVEVGLPFLIQLSSGAL